MSRIYPLFSSSKGNSYFCGDPENGILVDCGRSYKQIKNALALRNISFSAVKAILVTHTHSDHICGLRVTYGRVQPKVYGSAQTLLRIDPNIENIEAVDETPFCAADTGIIAQAIPTKHDSAGSRCYRLTFPSGGVAVICTDLGVVDETVRSRVEGAGTVFLESNYDPEMLRNCSYDYSTKARIASNNGHLSNEASAKFAGELIKSGTTQLILSHLSENSNTPKIARETHLQILGDTYGYRQGKDFLLSVLAPECDNEYFKI
jgi:phosphoribosyl 1,2-cyclic phosphodiesterase